MSDVKAIRYLLANNAPLIATVPATRIVAGILPQGTAAPALAITHISTLRRHMVADGEELCSSRVQVTLVATTYPALMSLRGLVKTALPRSRGTVNGVRVDSVLFGSEGPDFDDEAGLLMRSLDFFITYTE